MSVWGSLTTGTASHAFNTNSTPLNVAYPTVPTGNAIFLALSCPVASDTFTLTEPGSVTSTFSQAVFRNNNLTTALYWKIANGTETGNLQVAASDNHDVIGQMAYAAGAPGSVSGNVIDTNGTGFGPNTGQGWPALTVTASGLLIITVATKSANTSGYNTPSPWSNKLSEQQNNNGPQTMIWEYVIQTTQTNITAGNYTITTDSSATTNRIIAAFAPGIDPPGMQLL